MGELLTALRLHFIDLGERRLFPRRPVPGENCAAYICQSQIATAVSGIWKIRQINEITPDERLDSPSGILTAFLLEITPDANKISSWLRGNKEAPLHSFAF